ncbi:NADH oxidase [Spiroplasma sabaudiense Ar-1343]|uniref:NADH oxidase n=1 Tax=Spiroplasma sabaudiense Ar-1343 TaxID=1276257 RepID=W6A8S7_9MOLU|nr:FAD-dependent oxidoreductase [Spiroplasma sabaudiense]AHI53563.1 NADH oxidase [Spiroplasma sabaudiense Ar-1343]
MRVVVIGGAAMGMGVVAKLMRLDPTIEIVVFQKNDYVSLGACGIPYFIGNKFSDSNIMLARKVSDFENNKVKVFTNTIVEKIDFEKKQVFGKNNLRTIAENYDKLVIATGGTPITPDVISQKYENCYTVNSKEDAEEIKRALPLAKNIVIIGAGLIGLEVAENISHSTSAQISIIEKGQRPLANLFDSEFTDLIEDELQKNQVNLIKNSEVIEIKTIKNKISEVILKDNTKLKCDLLICSIGIRPNTDFLIGSELKLNNRNAIIIDKTGLTNLADVYSGGDCVQTFGRTYDNPTYTPLATVASKHATIVAENICGAKKEFSGTLNTAIVKVFALELARTGDNLQFLENNKVSYQEVFIKDKDHTNYLPGQENLYLKIYKDKQKNTLINAQMAGYNNAVLRIHSLISLIWTQTNLTSGINEIDLPYAPPFSRTKDIINIALGKIAEK